MSSPVPFPIIDIHCHCLPGLDDGPATLVESLQLCRRLVREGVTTVVATPHQLGRYDGTNGAIAVRNAVQQLRDVLTAEDISLKVLPGGDVRVDDRLAELIQKDQVLTLGDRRRYILIELPHDSLISPKRMVEDLLAIGVTPVLSHPERHPQLRERTGAIDEWLKSGAILQVTAGSLVGNFGEEAQATSLEWVDQGIVHVVASDAHNIARRAPVWRSAITTLLSRLDEVDVKVLCHDNPKRIIEK